MSVRVEVLGGGGTVCRIGDVIVWLPYGTDVKFAAALVEALTRARALGTELVSVHVLAGIVDTVCSSGTTPGALAAVRIGDSAVATVVSGPVSVSNEAVQCLTGDSTTKLVYRDLDLQSYLTIRGSADPDPMHRAGCIPFDLRTGAVPGGGFVLHAPMPAASSAHRSPAVEPLRPGRVKFFDLAGAPPQPPLPVVTSIPEMMSERPGVTSLNVAASDAVGEELPVSAPVDVAVLEEAPAAEPATEEPPLADSVDVPVVQDPPAADPTGAQPGPGIDARPVAPAPSPEQEAPADLVRGIRCARGHFNHPEALYCRQCGIGMVQKSVAVTEGLRPSLGVLILDDGTTFSLDAAYVIGRLPQVSEAVQSGSARPLVVEDGTGEISRSHATVRFDEWNVVVTDLGSRNGTHLMNPGEPSWTRLVKDVPTALRPGARIAIGRRKLEFQTLQRER